MPKMTIQQIDLFPAIDFGPSGPRAVEEKLVILFSRTALDEKEYSEAGSMLRSEKVDWDRFLELANIYQVSPLVYRSLQNFSSIPERVNARLREWVAEIFAYNVRNLDAARLLSGLFRREGVDAIFTKGVSYLMDVYGDIGLREMADIDLLVRPEDARKVHGILKEQGFTPSDGREDLDDYRAQKLYSRDDGICLDIHRSFIGRMLHNRILNMDVSRILERARELSMDGVRLRTLDIVNTLLYQCLHVSMQHSFSGVRWYVDINEFVRRHEGEINWEDVTDAAGEYRIRRPVYYTLLFARNMFGTPVPEAVFEDLGRSARKSDRWLFRKIKNAGTSTGYIAELAMFDSIGDMIKFVLLSFITYPYLIAHFLLISGKTLKAMCARRRSMAAAPTD